MTVRNNWVEADFALLNGAPTYLHAGREPARGRTTCASSCRPRGRRRSPACPMRPAARRNHYRAPDYDTLVDSPDRRRQSRDPSLHRRRQAAPARERRGRGRLRRRARRPRSRTHRPGRQAALGIAAVRQVRVLQPARERERRAGAQELRGDDGEPLGDRHARQVPGLAEPRVARVLPPLEREAPPSASSSGRSTTSTRSTRAASGSPKG